LKGYQEGFNHGVERGIEQGVKQGIEQGTEQGIEQNQKITIINMHNKNIDIKTISEITELPESKINEIIENK